MVASESVALEGTGPRVRRATWRRARRSSSTSRASVHAQPVRRARRSCTPACSSTSTWRGPTRCMDGISVYQARLNLGETLAQRVISTMPPSEIDVVIPIPESSRPIGDAAGAAARQALPRRLRQEPLRRPHLHHAGAGRAQEVGAPEAQRDRQSSSRAATCCWWTTRSCAARPARRSCRWRATPARSKVYLARAAPPVRFPNVYGIDMPTTRRAGRARPHGRGDPRVHRRRRADLPGRRRR